MTTGRATVIDVSEPLAEGAAGRWLESAGEEDLDAGLAVLNRALHGFRLVTADPYLNTVGRRQLLVGRIGYGDGDQVADGLWTHARELSEPGPHLRRLKVLQPQARLAAVLSRREHALACEELVLRARLDLDHGRDREAALQLLVALDAALAELARDPTAATLTARLEELRGRRGEAGATAQAALGGGLDAAERGAVAFTLERLEAALRARAVANA